MHCLTDGGARGRARSLYEPAISLPKGAKEAVNSLRRLPLYSLVTESDRRYQWTITGNAWGHLSHPVDVSVGRFPAVCARPVRQGSHVELSIAMTKHQADQAHGGTEY